MTKKNHFPIPDCLCCNPAIAMLSRRFFLLGTGSFAATVPLGKNRAIASNTNSVKPDLISQQSKFADAIYINGEVVTVNDAQPTAEAIAIQKGKILAVGTRKEVLGLKGNATKIIDLKGKMMVPGFFDGHGHIFNVGVTSAVANLSPPPDSDVDSIAKLVEKLRQQISKPPTKALGWVVGNGYDDPLLAEQRHPIRDELDQVSTELPVIAMHSSRHLAAVNSKGLELMGYTAKTTNPPGGVIQRRSGTNKPSGVLEENAFWAVMTKLATPSLEQTLTLVQQGCEIYASFGFTTAQEGRATKGALEGLQYAAQQGKLTIDVAAYVDYLAVPEAHTIKWSQRQYHNHLRLAGAKLNLDGSPQGKTAWLTQPYYIPPEGQKPDYKGYPSVKDEVAIDRVSTAFQNNFQIQTHCNGDAAIDQYIRAVRATTKKYPASNRRPVMIHAQTVREDQLDAMKELGIFPAMFPSHTFYWGDWHRDSVLGPDRANRISPTQSALKRQMWFSSHNDAPVVLPSAMRLLWSAVNRRTRSNQVLGADQRVTPLEGLKSITLWAAYQHFEEDTKGSIEVGKLADFAIVFANPLTVDPMTIRDIEVLETIKEGKMIYQKEA